MSNETTNQNTNQNTAPADEEKIPAAPEQPAEAAAEKLSEPVTNIPGGEEGAESAENALDDAEEKQELIKRIDELEAELLKEQIKVKLLVAGILPEKLEDGAAMAYGLCLAGRSAGDAADEITAAYPHLKAVRAELPQFSAESAGSKDGFSAIRRIFSSR